MAVAELLFRLLGVGLIFSGITDCATTLYFAGKIRDYFADLNAVDSTFVEIVDEDRDSRTEKEAAQGETVKTEEAKRERQRRRKCPWNRKSGFRNGRCGSGRHSGRYSDSCQHGDKGVDW